MYLSEKEVTLKLTSRPLRLVYLVRNREEFKNAIMLYTHIWGGLTNAILPIHENGQDIEFLKERIISINPDFIFSSYPNSGESIYTILEKTLAVKCVFVNKEQIQQHIEGKETIPLHNCPAQSVEPTSLSHIVYVFREFNNNNNTLDYSRVLGVNTCNFYDFELSIQSGKISNRYRTFLTQHLAANFLNAPQDFEQLIKNSLLLAKDYNPICLTKIKLSKIQPLDPIQQRMDCPNLLTIFLGDDQDIDIAAAYWNTRSFTDEMANKLYLPKSEVLDNIDKLAQIILEGMPSIEEILIVINTDIESAQNLAHQVAQAFLIVPHFRVEIIYQNFHLIFSRGQAFTGSPINTTYIKFEDGSVRFSPPVPIGHQNTEFLFGWEAEVRLASSRRLLLPINKSSAVFLSNSQHQIEFADNNPYGRDMFIGLSTRVSSQGITGTVSSKQDCCLYIPTDEMVITQRFKDAGLKIEINEHTRYAKGFIKRFGGFRKTIDFVNDNGLGICKALERRTEDNNRQVQQGGYKICNIYPWLNNIGINDQTAKKKFVSKHIPVLLSVGLVRRGYNLSCSHCNLTTWYPIERVQEFIECVGCAEPFQLPEPLDQIHFTYKLNELASHFLRNGGDAVLITAAVLSQLMPYSWIQFGGNIHRRYKKASFAEIDVIGLQADTLVLAESKSYSQIEEQHIEQIKESLEKTIEVAKLVNAQIVLLSITKNSSNSELHTLHTVVSEISHNARELGIGVHLAINGKLHPWGKEESELYQGVNILDQLRVDQETPEEQLLSVVVGELPSQGFISSQPLLDDEVMQRWRLELGANQASA
ncbi:hypothetical protein QUB75_06670 [Microcoleus sp. K1-B6]|uniref:hypothetical protein n=1 Tax=unclassified Microcoleus TaxID=2642155 RepID=UPI002FD33D0A